MMNMHNRKKAKPIGGRYKRKEFNEPNRMNSATVKENRIMAPSIKKNLNPADTRFASLDA